MNNSFKITILGCGSSVGTPLPGCQCYVCQSKDEKNIRNRTSILIEYNSKRILIDTGDLRSQMLRLGISYFDYVLYTHYHSDHFFGAPDLLYSVIQTKKSLNIYGNKDFIEKITEKIDFLFVPSRYQFTNYNTKDTKETLDKKKIEPKPILIANTIKDYEKFTLDDNIEIQSFQQNHGSIDSTGYAFLDGKFVYSPDFKFLLPESLSLLRSFSIDTWIVPLTNKIGSRAHIGLDELKELILYINPKRVFLVHMNHSIDYYEIKKYFHDMNGIIVEPSFDYMEINL